MKIKNSLLVAALFSGAAMFSATDAMAQTCRAAQPTICSRSCWSARASSGCSSMTSLTRATIHHTAGTGDYTSDYETGKAKVRGVQNYHMDNLGWCDVAYHFLFNAAGDIYEGRVGSLNASSWYSGAHDGCNSSSMGFSNMGYYHSPYNQAYTAAQEAANESCIAWRMPTGWSATSSGTYCGVAGVPTLCGHYQVKATACPGTLIINRLSNIRTDTATKRSCGVTKTARNVDNPAGVATGLWSTGTSATDKFGTDYRYRSTAAISEPFTWSTTLNTTATWNVKAWWSQGANRSASAPYVVSHGGGSATVYKNQQANGGSWQLLGSWSMGGAQDVQLSCWAATGFIVLADAVRWE